MAKRKPKAHDFEDGGGLVTGTHDVAAAVPIMRQHYHDLVCGWNQDDIHLTSDACEELDWITAEDAELITGRLIPNADGWRWITGYKLGTPGVTKAVIWRV